MTEDGNSRLTSIWKPYGRFTIKDRLRQKTELNDYEKSFLTKFVGIAREDCILLIARALLRELPLLRLELSEDVLRKHSDKVFKQLILPTFRGCAIVLAASIARTFGERRINWAALSAASAAQPDLFEFYDSDILTAVQLAALSTTVFSDARILARSGEYARAMENDNIAYEAAAKAAAAVCSSSAAKYAFENDFLFLFKKSSTSNRRALALKPLWPIVQFGLGDIQVGMSIGEAGSSFPVEIRESWLALQEIFILAGDNWDVWVRWYSELLNGTRSDVFLFGLSTDRALKLLSQIALIKDEIWESGPALLNTEFKRLVEIARFEVESKRLRDLTSNVPSRQKEPVSGLIPNSVTQAEIVSTSRIIDFKDLQIEIDGYLDALDKNFEIHLDAAQSELQKVTDLVSRQPWREEIERVELLRSLTTELRELVKRLSEGKASEVEAKKQIGKFREGFEDWWQKRHIDVFDKATDHTLNAIAFTVFTIVGTTVGSVIGVPHIGMICGATAYSGKGILGKAVDKLSKL